MRNAKYAVMMASIALLTAGSVQAAEDSGWKFEVTPYAWLAGLEGDLTIANREVEFDKSFSDLFDATELAGSVRLGAEYNRFLVGGMLDYFSMSTDELDVDDQPNRGSIDSDLFLAEVAVGYRVDGFAEGQTFGVMVGVRSTQIDNKLKSDAGGSVSRDNDLVDGMFYLLPSVPVFPSKIDGLRFNPVLGIGAGDSDLVYEMFPQFQYQITDVAALRIGYRTAGWKFEGDRNDDNELDISMSGLIAGLGFVF